MIHWPPRSYRYITFAEVDVGLLLRIIWNEPYLVPTRSVRDDKTAAVSWASAPAQPIGGVRQAICHGSRRLLDQLADEAPLVFTFGPLWSTEPNARTIFKTWDTAAIHGSLAGVVESFAGGGIADDLLAHAAVDDDDIATLALAELVSDSRAARKRLTELDDAAMRCLDEHRRGNAALDMPALQKERRAMADRITANRDEYVKLTGGQEPEVWPL